MKKEVQMTATEIEITKQTKFHTTIATIISIVVISAVVGGGYISLIMSIDQLSKDNQEIRIENKLTNNTVVSFMDQMDKRLIIIEAKSSEHDIRLNYCEREHES